MTGLRSTPNDYRQLASARRDAEEALFRYAELARVWNAPDDEHTRYQIRRLVDDVIEDTMQDLAPPCKNCGAAGIERVFTAEDGELWFCRECNPQEATG